MGWAGWGRKSRGHFPGGHCRLLSSPQSRLALWTLFALEPARCKFSLILLALAVLPWYARAEQRGRILADAHSLCYAFNVSASGPSWCEVRGKINGTTFLKYTCSSHKAKPINPLGVMLNATEVWNQLVEHWKDLVEELRKALLDNRQNIYEAFDSLSLQGHMMCQQKFTGQPRAFWEFGFNGQMCLRFDSKNRSWTELHPGCRSLKETLESDRYVTNLLVVISHGDCVKLLNQSRVLDTKAAPTVAPAVLTVSHNISSGSSHRFLS
ncbi:UL16-binding protein 1-like [Sturnira hondurensis]|uniref:UL16-binding protein 1-like n=1 Tax=Sturnira hondurensis TaxID=192404 RepID=UPI001879F9F8|nr:UL16-binding protein 1-like [Sturnira hondurensis]